MGTTMQPDHRHRGSGVLAHIRASRPRRSFVLTASLVVFSTWLCSVARAQTWRVEPGIELSAVGTSNVDFAPSGSERSDVVLTISPQVRLLGSGGGYRVVGTVGADGVAYLGRTIADRVMPRVSLTGNAVLVDRFLFLDGDLSASSTAANAFGALGEGATTVNRGVSTRERISPYISRELSPASSVLARSDNVWVQSEQAGAGANSFKSYVQSDVVRFDYRPQPLGMRAEVTRLDSPGSSSGLGSDTVFDVARVTLLYAPVPELQLGIDGGRDRAVYGLTRQSSTVLGGSLRWLPTERTVFDGLVESRFFGTGWDFSLTHRSPFVSITAGASRQATTYSALLASLQPGATGSVSGLLDAALTTQFPDPIQRAGEVANLIAKYNLPTSLSSALDLYTNTAQLQQRVNLAIALLGARHTVTLSVFRQEGRDLLGPNDTPTTALNSANARQLGGTLNLTRRLTPDMTADASFTASRIAGYGVRAGQRTVNKVARFGATRNLSPRTSVTAGVRYQLIDGSGVANVAADAKAASIYAGALHRF